MTIRMPASMAGRKQVFDSVFPSSKLKDLAPTPSATPVLGQNEFSQSFGGPVISSSPQLPLEAPDTYPEAIIWDRAWHSATSFLALPGRDFVTQMQQEELNAFTAHYNEEPKNAIEAIRYVTSRQHAEQAGEQQTERESIVKWYTDQVRGHFLAYAKPSLLRVSMTWCHCG